MPPPNIYLTGAHCSGKTTLLQALQTHFLTQIHTKQPTIINEVVRPVMRAHAFTAADVKDESKGPILQRATLAAQFVAEQRCNYNDKDKGEGETTWFISDRSGLDPIVYAQTYVGSAAAAALQESFEWGVLRENMRGALVVLYEAGNADWVSADEVRVKYETVEEWEALHRCFVKMLGEQGIAFVVLPKETVDLGERVRFVVEAMEARMKSST
ncbi:uncharacterized protein K452DRAFT_335572 [Aplosporella prunicola CBS 121167]|uniref:NadR/Ttd14 AAA domain-containing protein n=1 Tax=Aplosporella prunicola CBS 121167 TaxID=1176127 RepID=A0A6A6B8D7_9PEZI|nr:uncharacterized protein K452DRAFT_335572 [Aplosporella prunicola CBS 121167]KAF2140419.1 hypothetical protein K452DRAFT_335572 [Aplosporella prunicola CBS 121167]